MLVDEKPPLDEDLLMHFGVRGMKWGQRKARDSGGSTSTAKPYRPHANRNHKIAVGLGIAAVGASVAAYILSKQSGTRIGSLAKGAVRAESKAASSILHPSPFAMRMEAGMAAHRNAMGRVGAQKLTDKAWRDHAKIQQMMREMNLTNQNLLSGNRARFASGKNGLSDLASVRRNLQDPSHVWGL